MKIQPWYVICLMIQAITSVLSVGVYLTDNKFSGIVLGALWTVLMAIQVLFFLPPSSHSRGWVSGIAEGLIAGLTCLSVFTYGASYFSELSELSDIVVYVACVELGATIAFYFATRKILTGEWSIHDYPVHNNQDLNDLLEKATKTVKAREQAH